MANNDLFAPPTAQELKEAELFAAPTKEELAETSKSAPAPVQAQSALQGFGQAATGGYLPQLQSALGGLMPNPSEDIDQKLKDRGFKVNESPDTYVYRRDEMIKRDQSLQNQAPGAYLGGQVGGALSSAVATGGLMGAGTKATGLAGGALKAAGAGAVQGALQNPGDTEGKVSPIQGPERLANAKSGAAFGAATFGVGKTLEGIGNKIASFPGKLEEFSQTKAFKAIGGIQKDFMKLVKNDNAPDPKDIGQFAIKHKLIQVGESFDDVAAKAAQAAEATGKKIGDTYKDVQAHLDNPQILEKLSPEVRKNLISTELNTHDFSDDLLSKFKEKYKARAGGTAAISSVQPILDELKQNGQNANLVSIQGFKSDLDNMINYNKSLGEQPLTKQGIKEVRDYLKDKIQERIDSLDKALGKNYLAPLKEANKQYGMWKIISGVSGERAAREAGGAAYSLGDRLAGGGGALAGAYLGYQHGGLEGAAKGAAGGAMLGVANKAARLYGNPILSNTANAAAQKLNTLAAPVSAGIKGLASPISTPLGAGLVGPRLMLSPEEKKKGLIK